MQSTDLAVRLQASSPYLDWNEGFTAEGVHFDAEFPTGSKYNSMSLTDILPAHSQPLTVLAVDAPDMRQHDVYSRHALHMLACKVILIHAVAARLRCPVVLTGLLGVDKLCNNRPLVMLLHLLLEPSGSLQPITFHMPPLPNHRYSLPLHVNSLLRRVDEYLARLVDAQPRNLYDAFEVILTWRLTSSVQDRDIES